MVAAFFSEVNPDCVIKLWVKLTTSRRLVSRWITTFLYWSSSPWGIQSSLQTHSNLISLCVCVVCLFAICLFWNLTTSLTHPFAQLLFFLGRGRGVGIKIEKEGLILKGGFWPPFILWITIMAKCIIQWNLPKYHYIKRIYEELKVFLWISCQYNLMSQNKTHGTSKQDLWQ